MLARVLSMLVVLLAVAPAVVRAQSSSEVAAARALFSEGLEHARANRWEDARDAFERSYAIAPRPTTLLNLAGAQVQTGRLVAGAETYRRFLSVAHDRREARYREQAETALREVEARIAHLTVRVEGLEDDDVVLLDGEELARAALGIELPVDPGLRTFVVRRGEVERAREVVQLAEGERREIAIDASVNLRVASSDEPPAPAPEAALQADPAPSGGDDTGLWIGVGVGAGVAVAIAVTIAIVFATQGAAAPYSGNLGPGAIQFE